MKKFVSKQKFHRGDLCKVPEGWSFAVPPGGLVIIEGSYNDLHGGRDFKSYGFWPLGPNGLINNKCAWLNEDELKLVSRDWIGSKELIQRYNEG